MREISLVQGSRPCPWTVLVFQLWVRRTVKAQQQQQVSSVALLCEPTMQTKKRGLLAQCAQPGAVEGRKTRHASSLNTWRCMALAMAMWMAAFAAPEASPWEPARRRRNLRLHHDPQATKLSAKAAGCTVAGGVVWASDMGVTTSTGPSTPTRSVAAPQPTISAKTPATTPPRCLAATRFAVTPTTVVTSTALSVQNGWKGDAGVALGLQPQDGVVRVPHLRILSVTKRIVIIVLFITLCCLRSACGEIERTYIEM